MNVRFLVLIFVSLIFVQANRLICQEKKEQSDGYSERRIALALDEIKLPFPANYRPTLPKFTRESDKVELKHALEKLAKIQTSSLENIPIIKHNVWFHMRDQNSTKETLIFRKSTLSRSPYCIKHSDSYRKDRNKDVNKTSPDLRDFDCMNVQIYTPKMELTAQGFFRRGLELFTIRNRTDNIYDDNLDMHRLLFYLKEAPEKFKESVLSKARGARYKCDVRENRRYTEVAFWPANTDRNRARLWVFDREKGGLLVHYEDKLVSSMTKVVDVVVEKFAKEIWLPKQFAVERYHSKEGVVEFRRVFEFFDQRIEKDLDLKEFSIFAFPNVDDSRKVVDQRTGRNQIRTIGEIKAAFVKEIESKK